MRVRRNAGATAKNLQDLLSVAADAAEELGKSDLAELLRNLSVRDPLESLRDFAHGQEKREYYESVKNMAEEAVAEAMNTSPDDRDAAAEALDEYLNQSIDGSHWVIYTHENMHVLVASDNWLAGEEVLLMGDFTRLLSQMAYYALLTDAREKAVELLDERFEEEEE